jgi:GT2 family glycosyltransferase
MIAIVFVSYERGELTQRCIDSLRLVAAQPFHIFLVDNGSQTETTKSVLRNCEGAADVTLTRVRENLGPAAGRNIALAAMPTEFRYVAMLDNDIVALPGWDRAALRAFESGADLIQPKLLEADGRTLERGPNRPNRSPLAANPEYIGRGLPADHPEVNRDEDAVIVGTAVVRREVLDRIGLFDERLHIGEDFDLSFRARAVGFALRYVPDCTLIHDHGFDFAYDQERGLAEKYLIAHVVLWRKWRKALLSPAYLDWYGWLQRHGEPMYLPPEQRWRIAHRRLRRRLVRGWIMRRRANEWARAEAAERATESLARRLGF